MIDLYKEIDKIEAKAKRKGITIQNMCKAAGVSNTSWCNWKAGAYKPKIDTLNRLSVALDGLK